MNKGIFQFRILERFEGNNILSQQEKAIRGEFEFEYITWMIIDNIKMEKTTLNKWMRQVVSITLHNNENAATEFKKTT